MRLRRSKNSLGIDAERFQVSRNAVWAAKHGITWKELPGAVPIARPKRVLNRAKVMRLRRADSGEITGLAREMGITRAAAWLARTGQTWKDLPGAIPVQNPRSRR